MSKYLYLVRQTACEPAKREKSEISPTAQRDAGRTGQVQQHNSLNSQFACSQQHLARVLAALEARCPALVEVPRWQQAVEDGRKFLAQWGEQAEALGWTAKDLFGLFPVPPHAKPGFRRLSRYDETRLVWLLNGRSVVALTAMTAAITTPGGATLTYRKNNQPALCPLGVSLDDLE